MANTKGNSWVDRGPYLVTGGSGFLGSALRQRMSADGAEATNFDRRSSPVPLKRESHVVGDIRNFDGLVAAMRGHSDVLHLAAEWNDVGVSEAEYRTTNVDGTRNVAEAAEIAGVRRIIFVSSCAIYNFNDCAGACGEQDVPDSPPTLYGQTKIAGERILREWAAADPGRSIKIVRPSVIYGPGNRGNVYNLARQVLSGRFLLPADEGVYKSIAFVENVVEFLGHLARLDDPEITINYCDLPQLTTVELVRLIRRLGGIQVPLVKIPPKVLAGAAAVVDRGPVRLRDRFGSVKVNKFLLSTQLDTERLVASGFAQPLNTEVGLARTIHWIKQQSE